MAINQDFRVRRGLIVLESSLLTGAAALSNTIAVTGNATFSNQVTVVGNAAFSNTISVTGNATFSDVVTFGTANVTFDTDTLVVDTTNDRVVINAASATVALYAQGDANVSGTFTAANIIATNITTNNLIVSTGNSTFDTSVMLVDAVNNRVGINNTTPDASLAVTGTANVSGAVRVGGTLTIVGATTLSNTVTFGGSAITVGNSTVNVVANSTSIVIGTGARANATALGVGSNVVINATALFIGNATSNAVLTQTTLTVANINGVANQCARGVANGTYLLGGGALTANITLSVDATNAATASKVVARDASGNFSANTITAALSGVATGANTLLYNTAQRSATEAATASTIVARDANANFSANVITATATAARYADLAEKYTTDREYPVGTVVAVADENNTAECTAANFSTFNVVGVVSENPAYLMNVDAPGQAIALKGRVPVRVVGPIRKGEPVVSGPDGYATVGFNSRFGVSLETNLSLDEKLVECVIL